MSIQNAWLHCTGIPDDTIIKTKLGEISGIVEMNIDTKTHAIEILYDDARITANRIEAQLDHSGYQMQR